ncbi:unnamed protein product [Closterium sp. NIES-65]|nr:unnamed protein product [Closterium sp. NIES-65]
MGTPSVLAFDTRAIDFDVWVDDLQLFLQCDRADGLSLFDLTSGASPAPAADADATVRSEWATRDAAARLAVHCHLPTSELTLLSDSLRVVRDHFLSVCPTTLTVDLLEKALLAAEKSIVVVGASRGDPRTPVFEGCSPLLPSVASATAANLVGLESVGARQQQQQQRTRDIPSPQQLREWYTARQRGGVTGPCTYVLRTGDRAGEQCGGAHSTQRCFGRLTDAWRHQFPQATEIPRWGELSLAGVVVFDLDFDAILAAMYAVTISDKGDCYRCFPPDPGIETAALGTGEAAALGASEAAALGARASAPSGAA